MKNKIVITGAAGFIGSHLVDFLLTKYPASSLRLLIAEKDSLKNLPKKKLDILRGDIRDKNFINKSLKGASTIYHLAAYTGFESNKYEDFKAVNVDGTQNLLDACKGQNIQKFVLFSTSAVYGFPAWEGDLLNINETNPYKSSEIYSRSKIEAEKRVFKAYEKWNIPYTIIRPTSVYGPRDKGQIFSLYKAIKNNTFMLIGNGKNKMHYVYVKDLVKGAYLAQISKNPASHYILGGNQPTPFRDVVKYVAKSIGKSEPKIRIPVSVGLSLGYIGETLERITGIPSPIFTSRVKVMTRNWYYDISKARKELKYNPETSFAEGTAITGKWLLSNNLI